MKTADDVELRAARLDDAKGLASLLRALGMFPALEDEPSDQTIERVERHLGLCLRDDSHQVYVATSTVGALVGYCAVHWLPYLLLQGPEGFVSELFVHPAWRSRAVGARLLKLAEVAARQRGCVRLSLLNLRGRESYQRGFYEKHGWRERAEAANFLLALAPKE